MSGSRVRRRFLVDSLGDGGVLEISGPVLRHLLVVRSRAGDKIRLFDGRGNEIEAEIVELGDGVARVAPLRQLESPVESPVECWLVQALPTRLSRMDSIVRQCTELGVRRIVPVIAERSHGSAERTSALGRRAARWRRVTESAAEQCHRRLVPEVDEPVPFDELAWERLPDRRLIADPDAPPGSWSAALLAAPAASSGAPAAVAVLIGPEGGWSEGEVAAAAARGASRVRLGPRILRADTAGVVAVALVQHRSGDLGR